MSDTAKTSTKTTKKAVAANDRALLTVAETPLVETDETTDATDTSTDGDTSKVDDIKSTVADALPPMPSMPQSSAGRKKALGVGLALTTLLVLLGRHHRKSSASSSFMKKMSVGAVTAKAVQALNHRTR